MGQNTILAAGNGAADSSVVTVTDAPVKVGIFAAGNYQLPAGAKFQLMEATPGARNPVIDFTDKNRSTMVTARGSYYVTRGAYTGKAFGAFSETA